MNILKLFKKKAKYETGHTTIAGHRFTVLDPMTMPKIRQAAIFMGEYEKDWGMTKADILAYDDVLIKQTDFPKAWNTKDDLIAQLTDKLKGLYELLHTRRILIQEDFQYKPFLKVAAHAILLDDEKSEEIDKDTYQKKLELCNVNEEVLAFFLRVSAALASNTPMSLDTLLTLELSTPEHILNTEKQVLSKIHSNPYEIGNL